MRVTRIFHNEPLRRDEVITLSPKASNHALQVLRMQKGQTLVLFDGSGYDFEAKIIESNGKKVQCHIFGDQAVDAELKTRIHLVQGLVGAEKMDLILQKATELGVYAVQPVFTLFSQVKLTESKLEKKLNHWRAVMIAACEQCGRARIPQIEAPVQLRDYAKSPKGTAIVLDPGGKQSLTDLELGGEISVCVGPEGGFSDEEMTYLRRYHFLDVRLGRRILRTETAGLAAITALATLKGELAL